MPWAPLTGQGSQRDLTHKHGDSTAASRRPCRPCRIHGNVSCHHERKPPVPRSAFHPVDGIEQRGRAAIACIQRVDSLHMETEACSADAHCAGSVLPIHACMLIWHTYLKSRFKGRADSYRGGRQRTSISWLPRSANRLIRKVLMDLLRSSALSVPTSSLHSWGVLVRGEATVSAECILTIPAMRVISPTCHLVHAEHVCVAGTRGSCLPADVLRVNLVLFQQGVHSRQAHGNHILLVASERHVPLAQAHRVLSWLHLVVHL